MELHQYFLRSVSFVQKVLTKVTGGVPSPMGCRSFLPTHSDGYLGRMNLGVVTVNVPRCAIKANGDMPTFWKELDKAIAVAKEALDVRIGTCRKIKAKVAPILYLEGGYGLKADSPEELVFDRFFANNRASISLGYIGLYDTCIAMLGKGHHEDVEAHEFAVDIVKYMANVCAEWKEKENLAYSLYGSPSENLCGRFSELDRKMFGSIPDITDKGYHQNAFNVDVRAKIHPAEKINVEEVFPQYASGGFICYGELPSMVNNLKGLEQIIDYALDNVPYYAVNVPSDLCLNKECGYDKEFSINEDGLFQCPACGNKDQENMVVIRRVSGYLGSPNNRPFPLGKYTEMTKRSKNC